MDFVRRAGFTIQAVGGEGSKLGPDDDAELKLLGGCQILQLETSDVRAVSGCHNPCRGHGNADEREL